MQLLLNQHLLVNVPLKRVPTDLILLLAPIVTFQKSPFHSLNRNGFSRCVKYGTCDDALLQNREPCQPYALKYAVRQFDHLLSHVQLKKLQCFVFLQYASTQLYIHELASHYLVLTSLLDDESSEWSQQ